MRRSMVALGAALIAVLPACTLEEEASGDLGSAIELCVPNVATNVETTYEEIGEMLAKISVEDPAGDMETEVPVRSPGAILDPTNPNEVELDYVDQPGEIACVTQDGTLVFNVGGIIVREAQKLTHPSQAATTEPGQTKEDR